MTAPPIRLVVDGDVHRSRLTVFFRLPLSIVFLIWLFLWSVVVYLVAIVGWLITLFTGRLPRPLHRFNAAYLRCLIHVSAFLSLAANPFPGFLGRAGSYPVDLDIDPPQAQNRWKTGFRLILVIPAAMLTAALANGGFSITTYYYYFSLSLLLVASVLAWFVGLALGRITPGLRDAMFLSLAYTAQEVGYILLLTDRYPTADPERLVAAEPPPERWACLVLEADDRRRNRLTVFFRLVLAIPHLIWLYVWGLLTYLVVFVNWFALLATGRSPATLHQLITGYIRYATSVLAYLYLLAERYPRFLPEADWRYTVDVWMHARDVQNRWKTLFRILLAVPALLLASAYGGVLATVALVGWFACLALGRMPAGLQNLGLSAMNYSVQNYAYLLLATDQYPYSGPAPTWAREDSAKTVGGITVTPPPPPHTDL